MPVDPIIGILQAFDFFQVTPEDFFFALLTSTSLSAHPTATMVKHDVSRILNIFKAAPDTLNATSKWVFQVAEAGYQSQIKALTAKDGGFHFFTQNISEEQLRNFSIEDTSERMQNHAPDLWNLLGALLSADESLNRKRELWAQKSGSQPSSSNASHAPGRRVDHRG